MEGDFNIGPWLIQPQLNTLVGPDQQAVQLEPKAMEVLVCLAEHPDEVLSKERILSAVWSDAFVTEDVLIHAVVGLRKAFGDDAKEPTYIQTIPKRGYRIMAPVAGLKGPAPGYEIVQKIGQGTMGEVFLANDMELSRKVALKFIFEQTGGEWSRDRFLDEARAAGVLDHPFICKVYGTGAMNDKAFVAMEYLEGHTLGQRLANGRMELSECLRVVSEAAEALEAAHDQGIVHRDLKPSNIMLTRHGHVKVMDFGLANGMAQVEGPAGDADKPNLRGRGGGTNTPPYTSPEQIRGEAADGRSDIFSLGLIFYEMLTGVHPFGETDAPDMVAAILDREPAPLSRHMRPVSDLLQYVIRKMLAKDPSRRYQSIRELRADLAEADTLSSASGAAIPDAREPLGTRWRLLRFLAAGVILLVAGAAAGYLSGVHKSRPTPTFQRLTYRRGVVHSARFSPDGNTILYGAEWGGQPAATFSVRPDSPEFQPAMISDAVPMSASRSGELAVLLNPLHRSWSQASLARVPLSGGTPREMLKNVIWADWGPNGKIAIVHQDPGARELQYPAGNVLFATTGDIKYPRFSPSGDRIAFVHYPIRSSSAGEIVVVTTAGAKKVLSGNWGAVLGLAWMPKTGEIWFTATRRGNRPELHAVTMAGACRTIHSETAGLILEDISGDGRVLLNSTRIRMNTGLLAPGMEGERDLSWLEGTAVTDISADGKYTTFTESGEDTGETPVSYYRSTAGSPPLKLGIGDFPRLSPDGKSVVIIPADHNAITVLPIAAGEPRRFRLPGFQVTLADWVPNRRQILFIGKEREQPLRAYLLDMDGGKTKAVTPAIGPAMPRVSPDGRFFTAVALDRRVLLFPLEGGDPVTCPGIEVGEYPCGWSEDSKSLYVYVPWVQPVRIYRVEWETGKRILWKEIPLSGRAGVSGAASIALTPNGQYCAYSYVQELSTLYLADGLR